MNDASAESLPVGLRALHEERGKWVVEVRQLQDELTRLSAARNAGEIQRREFFHQRAPLIPRLHTAQRRLASLRLAIRAYGNASSQDRLEDALRRCWQYLWQRDLDDQLDPAGKELLGYLESEVEPVILLGKDDD